MQYQDMMNSIRYQQQSATVEVPDSWLQGRSMFGGMQAALALKAMRTLVPDEFPLRTLQTTFMAPVPGGAVTATARQLRSGKNTRHVQAVIEDGDQIQASCIAVFGKARESQLERTLPPPRPADGPVKPFEFVPGVTPNFTQHFDTRWLAGDLPFSNSPHNGGLVEVSMREKSTTSEAHLLAIADFIPPMALAKLSTPSPGSSLTWMLEILDTGFEDQPLQGWLVDAEMTAAGEGYTSQTATIYAPSGSPVALSRQSMVVFG